MRRHHMERVVWWDRRSRFPERVHGCARPVVCSISLMWSTKGGGPGVVIVACSARSRRTGRRPQRVQTSQSVSGRRLVHGEAVGCLVRVSGREALGRREQLLVRGVWDRVLDSSGRDQSGNFTFRVESPGQLGLLVGHDYEGGVLGERGDRYVVVETDTGIRVIGRARLEGRRRPLR